MENPEEKHTQILFYLISTFELSAMQFMGKIKNPMTDKIEKNLEQAQFSIDIIDTLSEKTKGNLNEYEQKFISNVISQLKLNFLEELDKEKKGGSEKIQSEETK